MDINRQAILESDIYYLYQSKFKQRELNHRTRSIIISSKYFREQPSPRELHEDHEHPPYSNSHHPFNNHDENYHSFNACISNDNNNSDDDSILYASAVVVVVVPAASFVSTTT
jgi:hypothetical protein